MIIEIIISEAQNEGKRRELTTAVARLR